MKTVANLLAQKQKLLERLQERPGSNEHDQIQRLLAQVDDALNLLEKQVAADASNDA